MAFTKSRIQCYKGTTNCYLHNILTSLRQPNVIKDLVKLKCFSQFDCLKKFDNQSYHNVIFLPFSKKSIKASVGCEHIPSTFPENKAYHHHHQHHHNYDSMITGVIGFHTRSKNMIIILLKESSSRSKVVITLQVNFLSFCSLSLSLSLTPISSSSSPICLPTLLSLIGQDI